MTQAPPITVDSLILPAKEISLVEAYEQSAAQDKLIDGDFAAVLSDGLRDE